MVGNLKTPTLITLVAKNNTDAEGENVGEDVVERQQVDCEEENRVADKGGDTTNNQKSLELLNTF